jgi:signal transduction histidine kinase
VNNLEQIISFIKDYWFIIAVVLIAITLLNMLFNLLIKIILYAVVIGVILIVGFNYQPDDVIQLGKNATNVAVQTFNKTVEPIIESEISEAKTTFNPDGTFEMKTKSLRIVGKKGSDSATVYFKNQTFQVNINDLSEKVQNILAQQQRNS